MDKLRRALQRRIEADPSDTDAVRILGALDRRAAQVQHKGDQLIIFDFETLGESLARFAEGMGLLIEQTAYVITSTIGASVVAFDEFGKSLAELNEQLDKLAEEADKAPVWGSPHRKRRRGRPKHYENVRQRTGRRRHDLRDRLCFYRSRAR